MDKYSQKCPFCELVLFNKNSYKRHKRKHRCENGQVLCTICKIQCVNTNELRRHVELCHKPPKPSQSTSSQTAGNFIFPEPDFWKSETIAGRREQFESGLPCVSAVLNCGDCLPWSRESNLFLLQPAFIVGTVVPKSWNEEEIVRHLPMRWEETSLHYRRKNK